MLVLVQPAIVCEGAHVSAETSTPPAPSERARPGGLWAAGTWGGITLVVLVVMLVVLTRTPANDAGRRSSQEIADVTPGTDHAPGSTIPPSLPHDVPDLNDNVEWTAPIHQANTTCAGPTIVGATVAVMCDNRHMYGFDVATGETKWDTAIDQDAPSFTNPPTAAGDHLLLYLRSQQLVAVDAGSGAVAFRVDRPYVLLGVAAAANHIFLTGGGKVTAVDPANGQTQWESPVADGVNNGTGVRLDAAPSGVILTVGRGTESYAVDTGAEQWTATNPVDTTALLATATTTYVVGNDGHVTALDAATGKPRWDLPGHVGGTQQTVAGADADHVYIVSTRELMSVEAATGRVTWSLDSAKAAQTPDGIDRASFTDGHLMTRALGRAWELTPATGVAIAARTMNSASPGVVHDGKLFIVEATGNQSVPWRVLSIGLT
jgi:outer membrane protein assembly factor BamB